MSHSHSQEIKADGWKIYTADTFRTPNGTKRFRACRFCHDGRWTVSHFPKYRLNILICSFYSASARGLDMNANSAEMLALLVWSTSSSGENLKRSGKLVGR